MNEKERKEVEEFILEKSNKVKVRPFEKVWEDIEDIINEKEIESFFKCLGKHFNFNK